MVYANRLRKRIGRAKDPSVQKLAVTGHTATGVGQLVAIVGGFGGGGSEATCLQVGLLTYTATNLSCPLKQKIGFLLSS